ncbi:MAG TPA: hypothetical protein VHP55_02765 [Usitatibacter sp.]|jgi:hypothetical protein|nr:hypothetical protein [Usitatibacter sp.]
MHFEAAWHADGLRWIATILEDIADYLERPDHEAAASSHEHPGVEEARLRVHLRGF